MAAPFHPGLGDSTRTIECCVHTHVCEYRLSTTMCPPEHLPCTCSSNNSSACVVSYLPCTRSHSLSSSAASYLSCTLSTSVSTSVVSVPHCCRMSVCAACTARIISWKTAEALGLGWFTAAQCWHAHTALGPATGMSARMPKPVGIYINFALHTHVGCMPCPVLVHGSPVCARYSNSVS